MRQVEVCGAPPVTKVPTQDIARDNGQKASTKGSEKRRERGELDGIPEVEDQGNVNEGKDPGPSTELEPDVQGTGTKTATGIGE